MRPAGFSATLSSTSKHSQKYMCAERCSINKLEEPRCFCTSGPRTWQGEERYLLGFTINLSICPYVCIYIYMCVCLSLCLPVYTSDISGYRSIYSSILCVSMFRIIYIYMCIAVWYLPYLYFNIYICICLPIYPSSYLSMFLLYQSICRSICLPIYLSIHVSI